MMLSHLSKTMTAGVLAVTLALTAVTTTATPASANGHRNNGADAAAVLGGLILLYGISQAGRNHGNNGNYGTHRPRVQEPGRPRNVHRVAPSRCFIQGHDNHGQFRGYRQRCMQQHAQHAHMLPSHCLRNVWTQQGQRTIYRARCLTDNGWARG